MRALTCTCTCKQHACTPTHMCTHVAHTMLVHVSRHTHIHTQNHIHMLCACMHEFAHLTCAYTSIQHTGVHVHMCTHVAAHTHPCASTRAHTHTCTRACGLAHPLRLQGGCISATPMRAALARFQARFCFASSACSLQAGSPFVTACHGLRARHMVFSRLATLPCPSLGLSSSLKTCGMRFLPGRPPCSPSLG